MTDKVIDNTPEEEVNVPEEVVEEAPTEEVVEAPEELQEETVGDEQEEPEIKFDDAFYATKRELKAAKQQIKELQKSIERGATASEIDDDIADISEAYNVDANFLEDFAERITRKAEKALEAKLLAKESEKEKVEKFEDKFSKLYKTALERGPEFESIANMNVIKALAKLPENSKKTVSQLLEETYGNALTGKRSIETTKPGGGKDPEPLDIARAEKDIAYFEEIMKDPKKKAQYNEQMLKKGF